MTDFTKIDMPTRAKIVHKANAKWWIDLDTGKPLNRNKYEMLSLMISEISEALEGERKDLNDDHIPSRKMAEVEIADLVIRTLDFAGGFGYPVDMTVAHSHKETSNRGEALYYLAKQVVKIGDSLNEPSGVVGYEIQVLLSMSRMYCVDFGYDLWGAVSEKFEYNKERADHKVENRKKDDGKKF